MKNSLVRRSFPISLFFLILTLGSIALAQTYDYPHEEAFIEIMFIQESAVRLFDQTLLDESGLNAADGVDIILASHGGGELSRTCEGVPVPELDFWQVEASANLGEPVYNLNNIYRIRLLGGADPIPVSMDLQNLPGVHMAYPVPLAPELPTPPNYQTSQNYLQPAASTPTGVDAFAAWATTGGDGTGVTVCDIEYSWNASHNDVTKTAGSTINFNNVGDPFADNNHGTSVVGVLVSDDNTWGTTGICKGASLKTCGCFYGSPTQSWNLAGAISISALTMQPGDVILLEQQWDYMGNNGYVPVEWAPLTTPSAQTLTAVYAAIQNAVGMGIHVVEAGGNGGVNTDTMTWYGDSGAIIVGAGGAYIGGTYPNGDLQKLWYSSYGSRFDLQGWGENVVTTGSGDLYSAEGVNRWYTSTFDGTSSASPMVAGAVACLVGWYAQNISTTPLTPAVVRSTLIATGTPQAASPAGNIGPRPDLAAAIASITVPAQWTDVTSGPLGDTGYTKSIAWADFDLDGDDDIYITNSQSWCRMLRNDGVLGFTDVTSAPEANQMFAFGAMWGDQDNDGDPDLYVSNFGNINRLFRNDMGPFFDVPDPTIQDFQSGSSVQWVDFDKDGLLDIYVTTINGGMNKLMKNMGGDSYMDFTMPPMDDLMDSFDSAWADFDDDGDMDCYLVRQNQPNDLFRNDGNGMFSPITPAVLADAGNGQGACWGDIDNDGDLDLYLCNYGSANRLFANIGGGMFLDVSTPPVALTAYNTGACFGDYDNDGDLDLYVNSGNGANNLLRNDGGWMFTDDTNGPLGNTDNSQGAAMADYDLDGDLDIYLANDGSANKLFRNDVNNGNHWLHMDLTGTYSNASAIGARVRIVTGGTSQIREIGGDTGYCGQNSLRVEFGLGTATMVDSVQVNWPNGGYSVTTMVSADQVVGILEPVTSHIDVSGTPRAFELHGCSPNPFNPVTTLRYSIPQASVVRLDLYDLAGRKLRTLVNEMSDAGKFEAIWNGRDDEGRDMPSGVYLARIRWARGSQTMKMVLAR